MDLLSLLADKTVIFTIANTIYVVSYLLTNMLWLRVLAVVAALSTLPYFYFQETPLWAPLFWQSAFLLVNLFNLVLLLMSMRPPVLSSVDKQLHRSIFSDLKPHEMMPILRIAERVRLERDEVLLREGQENSDLFLMLNGECRIERSGRFVATVGQFEFLGEMTFVDGGKVSGTVIATRETELYRWNRERLERLFAKQSLYKSYLYQLCGVDMASKIRSMNAAG